MTQKLDVEYDKVYIIDCLPENQYTDFQISQSLNQFFDDNKIPQKISICRSRKLLLDTLQEMEDLAKSGTKICIHIISHGTETGVWIESTNEEVTWTEFRSSLKSINTSMGETLTLNMTSCFGLHGIKIVDDSAANLPFFGLIGYSVELEVERAKEINYKYYEKMLLGKQINVIVRELQTELSDDNIYCISALGYKDIKNKQENS